jgi:hypothetical protein
MIAKLPVKVLDGKLSKIDELELRLMNLEAIIQDIRLDLTDARNEVKDEDLKRLEKLNKYQKTIDSMWLNQSTAV